MFVRTLATIERYTVCVIDTGVLISMCPYTHTRQTTYRTHAKHTYTHHTPDHTTCTPDTPAPPLTHILLRKTDEEKRENETDRERE